MIKVLIKPIKYFTYCLGLLVCAWSLLSSSSGVQQGVSGSPAEAVSNSCGFCHNSPGNYVPSIKLEVFNQNQNQVNNYKPGESYTIKVSVSATNNPKSFGFQLSTLDLQTNSDQGNWTAFGDKVKQLNLVILQKQRKYIVQSNPKADGIFTATWKAPDTDKDSIRFYFAGLAVNLNGNESGDTHITGQLTLSSQNTTSSDDTASGRNIKIYPNPAIDIINIDADDIDKVVITDIIGRFAGVFKNINGSIDIGHLNPGLYYLSFQNNAGTELSKKSILKK